MPAKSFAIAGAVVILIGGAAIGYAVTRNGAAGMTDASHTTTR